MASMYLSAYIAACVLFVEPTLRMVFRMWTFTVDSLNLSSYAISLFGLPCLSS